MSKRDLKSLAISRRLELADQEVSRPELHKNVKPEIQEKRVKCTYELSLAAFEGLEEARLKLRRLVGRNVKRYEIVEASLNLALENPEKLATRL